MKTPFLSFTNAGIIAVILGLVFMGLSSHHSNQNDEFLERGLLRTGRVISQQDPRDPASQHSGYLLRVITNISPNVSESDIQIIEVEVTGKEFKKATVGVQLKLILIPDHPPRARLAGSAKRKTHRIGYAAASLCIFLGLLLLWLDWHPLADQPQSSPSSQQDNEEEEEETTEVTASLARSNTMEMQLIKDPVLYDGPFEFSYSAEKTKVELKDGTIIHVSQYRPIADLPKVLADPDLLHVLRNAQNPWNLLPTIKTGRFALSHLLKEKHVTQADQFFINGSYLGLLNRDEVSNGIWRSIVRGIWKITPLSRAMADLTSGNPDLARQAAFDLLNHPDLYVVASLAPGLPAIREAVKNTPRTGAPADDRRFITRAADIIDSLANGHCYCQVYAKTSDPPHILIKKGKFTLLDEQNPTEKKTLVTCCHCKKGYTISERLENSLPYYAWEIRKESIPDQTETEPPSP